MTKSDLGSDTELVTFTASVGDTIKIGRPAGYPPYPRDYDVKSVTPSSKPEYESFGFKIGDQKLGKFVRLSEVNWDSGFIYYKHEKSGKQVIEYISNGIRTIAFYIIVSGIQVHDHASIYQGGPAFATYYAETPREET